MLKTRKAFTKRIKITSTGKLLRRVSRQNHFNAKSRRATQLRNKSSREMQGVTQRHILASLPNF